MRGVDTYPGGLPGFCGGYYPVRSENRDFRTLYPPPPQLVGVPYRAPLHGGVLVEALVGVG